MIKQQYQQEGLLAEKPNKSIFPMKADLVLVFFPSPGVYVRDKLTVPPNYTTYPVTFYEADGEPFEDMYVFLPAVLKTQYDSGMNESGIVYEKETLYFEKDLIEHLESQTANIIEHHLG
ncbi:Putative uncharacterized protein [Moritella viscosa]|uniref:hypothetical protein n=1 Tax=Moritella viscosa TaxID=80854 RepID=UPI000914C7BB|nr:hypothetical protein [Moritella viscosa]SGZ03092.1 Putative uncharacterized protein [Moritella viscosa]